MKLSLLTLWCALKAFTLISQDTTTPEYTEFEYPDNTFDPDNQEESDYSVTDRVPEFQPSHTGGEHSESLQPASSDARPSPPEDVAHQESHGSEDAPLTSEPGFSSELAGRRYVPPNHQEAQEQQPQVRAQLLHNVCVYTSIEFVEFVTTTSHQA